MPYVKHATARTVTLKSDSHYHVIWHDKLKYGHIKEITKKAVVIDPQTGEPSTDPSLYSDALLLAHIESWNLDDEHGQPLPLTEESLALLEEDDASLLAGLLNRQAEERETKRKNS